MNRRVCQKQASQLATCLSLVDEQVLTLEPVLLSGWVSNLGSLLLSVGLMEANWELSGSLVGANWELHKLLIHLWLVLTLCVDSSVSSVSPIILRASSQCPPSIPPDSRLNHSSR